MLRHSDIEMAHINTNWREKVNLVVFRFMAHNSNPEMKSLNSVLKVTFSKNQAKFQFSSSS